MTEADLAAVKDGEPILETILEVDTGDQRSCSEEGLKYVCGFLAHKLRSKHPELCGSEGNQAECPWIDAVSLGRLTKPSADFLEVIKGFEQVFLTLHGNNISRRSGILDSLRAKLDEKFPQVHSDVKKLYVTTRTYLRIKHLKREHKVDSDRNARKIKHFTT